MAEIRLGLGPRTEVTEIYVYVSFSFWKKKTGCGDVGRSPLPEKSLSENEFPEMVYE